MASYVQKVLLPDEKIICMARLHWVIYLKGIALTIAGGLFGYMGPVGIRELLGDNMAQYGIKPLAILGFLVVIVGAAMILMAYIRQTSTELAITTRRIIAKYGFISRTTFEIMLTRITGANFEQTIMGRMMGYGTILVHGAGGEISPIDLVSEPQLFHRALMGVMEQLHHRDTGKAVQ